jgi:hypothetical protein
MTMQVLVPAETARSIAAEQARRDRARKAAVPNGRRRRSSACACAPPAKAQKRADRLAQKAKRAAQKGRPGEAAQLYSRAARAERQVTRNPKRRANTSHRVAAVVTLSRKELAVWKSSAGGRLKLLAAARQIAKRHGGRALIHAPGGAKLAEVG